LKNMNDNELENMIQFSTQSGTILQIIELEPINLTKAYYELHHFGLDAIEDKLKKLAVNTKIRTYMQKRRIYILPKTEVELIRPIENTEFCANCTRIRVTSDGKIKPCLMRADNLVDILTPMRSGTDDKQIEQIFLEAIKRREPYYKIQKIT
ncbi:molybdenum cofactor biosynthesis protein MoeA, partial [miscellaneous Crenarchaeota group-1 archaeon SG8-32-1]